MPRNNSVPLILATQTACLSLLMLIVAVGHPALGAGEVSAIRGPEARLPVHIDGDSGFTASNGVRSGSGTADDPYIISDWWIAAPFGSAITIKNTRSHVVVTSNQLSLSFFSIDDYNAAVRVENSSNIWIQANHIQSSQFGVHARDSLDLYILDNLIDGLQLHGFSELLVISNDAVRILNGKRVHVSANQVDGFASGIVLESSSEVEVTGNRIHRTVYFAAISAIVSGGNLRIHDNSIDDAVGGVMLAGVSNVTVHDNRIHQTGVALDIGPWTFPPESPARNLAIQSNEVKSADFGLVMCDSGCALVGNSFEEMEEGMMINGDFDVSFNRFANNSVAIGLGTDDDPLFRDNWFETSNEVLAIAHTVVLDLRLNWWGDEDGPDESKFHTMNGGSVEFSPWLTAPPHFSDAHK